MEQAVEAVFENGSFIVVDSSPLHLSEGQRVKLVVKDAPSPKGNPVDLLAGMYEGLSEKEIDEIEKIILDRRDFFGRDIQ